jgi:hypothetical protein
LDTLSIHKAIWEHLAALEEVEIVFSVSRLRLTGSTIRRCYPTAFSVECYHSLIPRAAGRPIVTAAAYTRSSPNMDPRAPR